MSEPTCTPPPVQVGPIACDFRRPLVMGIINLSPDSFSDGGEVMGPQAAVARARAMVAAGADLIDIGAVSTRPGALPVDQATESGRLLPAVAAVARANLRVGLGVDTARAAIAAEALAAGAHMINDQHAGEDPEMAELVRAAGATWVLMHGMMHHHEHAATAVAGHQDDGEVAAVVGFLAERAATLQRAGVAPRHLWCDVGLGFHKDARQNWALLRALPQIAALGMAVVVGASRKRFIGQEIGEPLASARDVASAAVAALAVARGAHVIRAHHVAATCQAVAVAHAMVA